MTQADFTGLEGIFRDNAYNATPREILTMIAYDLDKGVSVSQLARDWGLLPEAINLIRTARDMALRQSEVWERRRFQN